MKKFKIIYLPQMKWQIEVDGERSHIQDLDRPIHFGGYIALSKVFGVEFFASYSPFSLSNVEILDETFPPDMNMDKNQDDIPDQPRDRLHGE